MATAALIGGGLLLGGVASGIGASQQAKAEEKAAGIQAESAANALAASQAQQAIENQRAEALFNPALQAQQAQLALLGQGGDAAAQQAAGNLLSSPLVSAINEQNQQNIAAQAAASGVGGGNLLTALQEANTANILNAGLGGLGQIAGQQQSGALGFGGLAQGSLGMANQAQMMQGQALGNQAIAQGTQSAIPFLTGANILNQGTQLAGFGLGGGFGRSAQQGLQNLSFPTSQPQMPSLGGGTSFGGGAPIPQSGVIL